MLRLKGSHASKNCHDISAWILNLTRADRMRVILSGSVHQWDTTLDARGQDIFFSRQGGEQEHSWWTGIPEMSAIRLH